MSSYPPPPPPNQVPPNFPPATASYNRAVWKAQQRALKQQTRLQRDQMRIQMRSMRRRSIVGPLFLLALGVVFLLAQMGRLSWAEAVTWYGSWWPLVLVAAGFVLLAEWMLDQNNQVEGQPHRVRVLGGGVVTLLIFLAIAGVASRATPHAIAWTDRNLGGHFPDFDMALGQRHDYDDSVSSSISDGGSLLIRNPHGDVTVTGSSDDGQVHVSVHKQTFGRTDSIAADKESRLQPTFSNDGANLTLNVAAVEGGQADLTIQVPRTTMLTVHADHGDIDIQEIHAAVSLSANKGEVNLSGIDGAVNAHVNDENSSFTAHSVTGSLVLDGRAGDINVSEVTGPVSLGGDFFGTTHLEKINGAVSFKTSRTQFEAARIDGEFEVALDSDLEASQVMGPVKLTTRDREVTLDRVEGGVQVNNRNGAVSVTSAEPLSGIEINNSHGAVDLGVPSDSGMQLFAQAKDGAIENDFGLANLDSDHLNVVNGKIGNGGPNVKLYTTDGDITVRKASVSPLPLAAPAPRITVAPMPGMPKLPRMPKMPLVPPAPPAPMATQD